MILSPIDRSVSVLAMCAALAAGCAKDKNKLTAAECQRVYEHVLETGAAEKMKDRQATAGMSEADRKKIMEELRGEMKNDPDAKKIAAECERDFSRAEYECFMKATTEKAMDACEKL